MEETKTVYIGFFIWKDTNVICVHGSGPFPYFFDSKQEYYDSFEGREDLNVLPPCAIEVPVETINSPEEARLATMEAMSE